jgi:hypothetical protein
MVDDGLGMFVVPVARIEPVVLVVEVVLVPWTTPAVLLTPDEMGVVDVAELRIEYISTP